MVRPTTIKPAIQPGSQPQIIVIPQSMLAKHGIKTVISIGDVSQTRPPTLTRVIKPSVPIISRNAEANRLISLKRPLPQASPPSSGSEDDTKLEFYEDENGAKVRKRANLDHLTLEEKMMRRKLKNRVAAQNARDKKRVKMDDLEDTIKQLQHQNKILAKQNEELRALNRRLMAENANLKSTKVVVQDPATVFVKEEIETAFSPESLPPPPSQTPPLSSDEDDEVMLSNALPIEAVDTSSMPVSHRAAVAAFAERRRSPVSQRLRAPAECKVLQQQEQSRCQAAERATSQATVTTTAPEQLACLLWMCLLNPSQTSSQEPTHQSSDLSNLPFKKRSNWWHQACPPAIT